jgi:CRP/FNR family transcriptional regulator, nitrogen fixation regulation protein
MAQASLGKDYVPASTFEHSLEALGSCESVRSYSRGQEICGYGESEKYLYRVREGAARKFSVQPGGRRHIVDLLLPGNFFGFGCGGDEGFFVEAAIDRTVLAQYPLRRVNALARLDGNLALALQEMAAEAIARFERQMLILGKTTALEKVSCFLLEFSSRTNSRTSNAFALPISRYDIGDYLAISSETVCRSMTQLKQRGTISLDGPREVRIVDRAALEG